MKKDIFKNKKVTVMGLGLHGGGVAAVNWLVRHGAKVTVTDLKIKAELKPSLNKLTSLRTYQLVLGRHREIDFKNADMIVQNPGVPRESKYLKIARNNGVAIENEASLFFKYCPAPIIGVTGTRGKSTTATLIYKFIKEARSKKQEARIYLAGLPQKPMLEILDQVKANDLVVMELSSWQLEILGEQKLNPQVAVITNIYPDHLNRYASMVDYIAAKKNIFRNQRKSDFCVLNFDNQETRKMGREVRGRRIWFSKKYFPEQNGTHVKNERIYLRLNGAELKIINIREIKLLGEHNLENILAAVAVAGIFGIKLAAIKKVLKSFSGLPFRLELIKEVKGVRYINDTTATTPDGARAALKARRIKKQEARSKNIILIAGGDTKNIPTAKYRELGGLINKYCKAIILFSGKGSEQLLPFLKGFKTESLATNITKMADAVGIAKSLAKKGDIILLSPACASFNMFVNEFDRGEQFNRIVKALR